LSRGKATLGVFAATALEVTSPEFKLVVVELARALPALLFPPRKLRHGRRWSAAVPCAPPLLSPPARLGLGIGHVVGTYWCGLLRWSRW
jgi:hypothetical protein